MYGKNGLNSLDSFKIDDFWERIFLIVFFNKNIIVIWYKKLKVNIEKLIYIFEGMKVIVFWSILF